MKSKWQVLNALICNLKGVIIVITNDCKQKPVIRLTDCSLIYVMKVALLENTRPNTIIIKKFNIQSCNSTIQSDKSLC